APPALTGFSVGLEQALEFFEQIRLRSEVAEVHVAARERLGHLLLHRHAVVAMKAVALDERGGDALAPENLLEGLHHGRRAGARGAGHGNDRVHGGHQAGLLNKVRTPNRGASNSKSLYSAYQRARRSPSSRVPRINPMRSCRLVGVTSSSGSRPVLARPPACSTMKPIGFASYSRRRRPACVRSLRSRGYMNTPPRSRMRCVSATSEAIQRMLKSRPRGPALPAWHSLT